MRIFDTRYGLVPKSVSVRPTRKITVKSTSSNRKIAVNEDRPSEDCEAVRQLRAYQHFAGICNSTSKPPPLPVHINLHGSGFTLPNHGEDAEPSAYLSRTVPCTVLDATYALSPEHKLPEPINDVLDVIRYVRSNPHLYDTEKITIGGVSAGATAALLAATLPGVDSQLAGDLERDVVKSVVVWCPITDFSYTKEDRIVPPLPAGMPGVPIPHNIVRLFVDSCIREGDDLRGKRVSPMYAEVDSFPPTLFIVRHYTFALK